MGDEVAQEAQKKRAPRPRKEELPEVKYSKALSYLLRHGAAKEGLAMRPDGYVTVSSILARPKVKGLDLDGLKAIVADNAKQRFALQEEDGVLWIRANQGHSLAVEDLDLKPITNVADAPIVVHGTYERFWPQIEKEGLRVMTRNHMHFAAGLADENTVISGMRNSCNVFIYIDLAKALEDGIVFLRSANGVILTSGQEGVLEPKYFKEVVRKARSEKAKSEASSAKDTGQ